MTNADISLVLTCEVTYVNNIFLKIPFSRHVHLGSHEIIENNCIKVLLPIVPFFLFSFVQ